MQYAKMGHSGLVVSRLAFGAMTFGSGEGAFASMIKVDADLARQMIHRCLDAGVNFFDTADGYANGQSEELLGAALRGKREDVVLATKVFFRTGEALLSQGLSRRNLERSLRKSLQRLGTDYLDLYLVHNFDRHTPLEETLETLGDFVRRGLVRYVGFSNWTAWQAAKAVGLQERHGWPRFVSAQMYYSLIGRDLEHEVVPFLEDADIGTTIWSPLAGGLLTGKYTRESLKDPKNRLSGFDFLPEDKDHALAVVEEMRGMAEAHGASVAQVALAWLLSRPGVTSVLVGASKLSQLDDNLGALDVQLTAEQLARLDELTRPTPLYPAWFQRMTADEALGKALSS